MIRMFVSALAALLYLAAAPVHAKTERIVVHGASLEGNWEGNSPDRDVLVLLPPGYDDNPGKHYPVLYLLHGFLPIAGEFNIFTYAEEAFGDLAPDGPEMILVVPDSQTRTQGANYSPSPALGDFAGFVAKDLVEYVDAHYRTIPARESRGLAGHSLGGYGTLRIAMMYPQVFSSIYSMSACCVTPSSISAEQLEKFGAMSQDEMTRAGVFEKVAISNLLAWAPSPDGPPYFDRTVTDGKVDPLILARLAAASPLVMLPSHLRALHSMEAIALDVGTADGLLASNRQLHGELARFGVTHSYAEYDGDHLNRIGERMNSHVLPFFAEHLDAEGE